MRIDGSAYPEWQQTSHSPAPLTLVFSRMGQGRLYLLNFFGQV